MKGKLGNMPSRRDAPNLPSILGKPEIAISASSNHICVVGRSGRKWSDDPAGANASDWTVDEALGKPEIAVRASRNGIRFVEGWGKGEFGNGASRRDAPNFPSVLGKPEI